jgi:hypothetical protein
MLAALRSASIAELPEPERADALTALQSFLCDRVKEYHNRQRLSVVYDPAQSTWQAVRNLLDEAAKCGKEGPVAQYLVGAKLELRFPDVEIGNESYSTADDQLDRPGDFRVGDTAFHVTVAPMPAVHEKCKRNIEMGYRVYLLVSDRLLAGARQNATLAAPGRIAVESIESFVSNNIEELSTFSKDRLGTGFRRLLETYNMRVDEADLDKSMLVEIPRNLPSPRK